jgi:hypothetical protein
MFFFWRGSRAFFFWRIFFFFYKSLRRSVWADAFGVSEHVLLLLLEASLV